MDEKNLESGSGSFSYQLSQSEKYSLNSGEFSYQSSQSDIPPHLENVWESIINSDIKPTTSMRRVSEAKEDKEEMKRAERLGKPGALLIVINPK